VLSATVAEAAPGSEADENVSNSDLVQELVEVSNPAGPENQRRAMAEKVSSMLQQMQAAAAKTANTKQSKQALANKVAATLRTMIKDKQAAAKKKTSMAEQHTAAAKVKTKRAHPALTRVKHGASMLFKMAQGQEEQAERTVDTKKKKAVTQKKATHKHILASALKQIAKHRASRLASNMADIKASEAVMRNELDLGETSSTPTAKAHKVTVKHKKLHQYDNEIDSEMEEEYDDEDESFESVIHKQDMHLSRVLAEDKAQIAKRAKDRAEEKKTKAIMSELLGSGKKKRKQKVKKGRTDSPRKVHKVKRVKVHKVKPVHKPIPVTEVDVVGNMLEGLLGTPTKKKKDKAIKRPKLSAHEQRLASLHPDLKQLFGEHKPIKNPVMKRKTVAKVKAAPKPKPKVVKKAVPKKPALPVFHLQEPSKPKHIRPPKVHKSKSVLEAALNEAAEADSKISAGDFEVVKGILSEGDKLKSHTNAAQVHENDAHVHAASDDIFNSFETRLKKRVAQQAKQRQQERDEFAATVQRDMAASKARRDARRARRAKRAALDAKKRAKQQAHISRLHKLMNKAHRQMASDLGITKKGRKVQHAAIKKQISSHFDPEAKQNAMAASIAKKLFANLQKHGKKAISQEAIAAAVAVHVTPKKNRVTPKKKPNTPVLLTVKQAHVDKVFDKLDKIMEAKELLSSI